MDFRRGNGTAKRRVLIVNCYFDDSHRPLRRPWKLPYAMGPVYLAGAFSPTLSEIRLYNEVASGPLEDEDLLGWPDMLVLTGLTNSFDRMLHLTAYARTKNPRVAVVAGGPPVRALPLLSQRFFDYPCTGDVEQMRDVIADAFGPSYVAPEMLPRYDLAYWMGNIGHVEATRYCNFRCAFCALTGEDRRYRSYSIESLRRHILALGRRRHLLFIDNNFYGNDRHAFLRRVELAKELREAGHFRDWAAIVTSDFFHKEENLERVREAGCIVLFSGVESFNAEWLRDVNKTQNTRYSAADLIAKCLRSGIVFCYGLMLDVTTRRVADLRRELDFIAGTPTITLPAFLTLPIPLLGTPYFRKQAARGTLLPKTKLRDMDGTTLTMQSLDPLEEVAEFVRDMVGFRGYRSRAIEHSLAFALRYGSRLTGLQLVAALTNTALLCADTAATAPFGMNRRARGRGGRTHVTTTETADGVYAPAFRVAARYERYFRPTMVTDEKGELTPEVAEAASLPLEDDGRERGERAAFSLAAPAGFPLVARVGS